MQILAGAVPGLRHIRAPLIAGYLWIAAAWLLVKPDIHHAPTDAHLKTLWDLGQSVGKAGTIAALSVVAYLLGSLSTEVALWAMRRRTKERRWGYEVAQPYTRGVEGAMDHAERQLRALHKHVRATSDVRTANKMWLEMTELFAGLAGARAALKTTVDVFAAALNDHINLPATLLVDNDNLFAEVDRLRAEAELRLSVILPLSAVVVILATSHPPWAAAELLVLPLLIQGETRYRASTRLLADAIRVGKVGSAVYADRERVREVVTKHVDPAVRKAFDYFNRHLDQMPADERRNFEIGLLHGQPAPLRSSSGRRDPGTEESSRVHDAASTSPLANG